MDYGKESKEGSLETLVWLCISSKQDHSRFLQTAPAMSRRSRFTDVQTDGDGNSPTKMSSQSKY